MKTGWGKRGMVSLEKTHLWGIETAILPVITGRLSMGQSQPFHSRAWWEDERQWA